jgi:hypothetical protein
MLLLTPSMGLLDIGSPYPLRIPVSVALQCVAHSLKDANTGCSRASAPVIREDYGRCLASSPDLNEVFLETLSFIPLRLLQRQRWSNHLPLATPTANHIPATTTRAAVFFEGTFHFEAPPHPPGGSQPMRSVNSRTRGTITSWTSRPPAVVCPGNHTSIRPR